MSWNTEVKKDHRNSPFFMVPAQKDYLWGGTRLKDDFGKTSKLDILAETWECSTHPDGPSLAAGGPFRGKALTWIIEQHPELLGTHPNREMGLPILVKLIDAKADLSVQVHPDDDYARKYEGGSLGKSEMWYVVEAAPGAHLVYGFARDMTREEVRKSLEKGTLERYLQRVPIHRGDVFYIPAGQVHAIGAGALIAEVQENSNVTYRLYDYDRVDREGNRRPLHIDKALEVANLATSARPRQPMRVMRFTPGMSSELLCRCEYFQVEKLRVDTQRSRTMPVVQAGANSFQVLLCTKGCGMMFWEGESHPFYQGDCLFIPADSVEIKLHGQAQLLRVGC